MHLISLLIIIKEWRTKILKKYPKINTLYKRDDNGIIIPGDYSQPEFEYLKDLKFHATEKIDGTNISVVWDGKNIAFHGRTENANIPKHLLAKLESIFTIERMTEVFPEPIGDIILFGEGYGTKIQDGDNYIKGDVDFILFDVNIGNWWLQIEDTIQIALDLNIKHVPYIGLITIHEAEEMVSSGFKSNISHNRDYNAEGLILKAQYGLLDRAGRRIITKIKTCDYRKLKQQLKQSKQWKE